MVRGAFPVGKEYTESMRNDIAVIIAAFNEERTLPSVVEIVRSWGKATEIVVVDDGSSDGTYASVRQFVPDIMLIRHRTNKGKAAAMATAVKRSHGDILFFLDADTIGLTHRDLDRMLEPVSSGAADMVLGAARFWSAGKFEPFTALTGQRVMLRKHIAAHVSEIARLGYGIELFLNKKHEHLRTVNVRLPHVFILGKLDKQTLPDAIVSYLKEIKDLLLQLVTQYADEIGPHAKRIIKDVVRYSLRILDMLLS